MIYTIKIKIYLRGVDDGFYYLSLLIVFSINSVAFAILNINAKNHITRIAIIIASLSYSLLWVNLSVEISIKYIKIVPIGMKISLMKFIILFELKRLNGQKLVGFLY